MAFACRVMRLDVDPNSPDDVYATIEANGAMRSRNAGESWEDCTADLIRFCEQPKYRSRIGSQTEIEGMLDGHALACSAAAPGTVFLANRMGLFRSADRGDDLGGHGDRPLLAADLWPRHPHLAARPEGHVRGAEPGGALDRRLGLQERGCRQDLEALRPRHQGRRDDDGRRRAPDATRTRSTRVSRVGQVFGTQDGGKSWSESRLPEGVRDAYCVAAG